jgi:hypothetical protein
MEVLFSRPDLPVAVAQQPAETAEHYGFFKNWLSYALENNAVRTQYVVLIGSQWHDCQSIAKANAWATRALAFDIWVSEIMPDIMQSMLSVAPMLAFKTLTEIAAAPSAKAGDRVRAAEALLDRTGYARKVEIKRSSEDIDPEQLSTADLVKLVRKRVSATQNALTSNETPLIEGPSPLEQPVPAQPTAVYIPDLSKKRVPSVRKEVNIDDLD